MRAPGELAREATGELQLVFGEIRTGAPLWLLSLTFVGVVSQMRAPRTSGRKCQERSGGPVATVL